jgi:uncharacterized protein (TIGR02172 family)
MPEDYKMLGQGNTAEIYQYDENKILKLFRKNMPETPIQSEYKIAQILQNHLDNVPKVYDLIEYKDRLGIVYEQIQGIDFIKLLMKNALKLKYYSRMLASIHAALHEKDVDVSLSVKDKLKRDISFCDRLLPEEKEQIINYLSTLPDGTKICHFDFHPGNIMIREGQPVVLDWMTACTGDPNADVARTMLMLKTGEMMHISAFARFIIHLSMKIIGKTYLKEYIRLTNVKIEDIRAWTLPVAAARLTEWLTDHEKVQLLKLVRKELSKSQR